MIPTSYRDKCPASEDSWIRIWYNRKRSGPRAGVDCVGDDLARLRHVCGEKKTGHIITNAGQSPQSARNLTRRKVASAALALREDVGGAGVLAAAIYTYARDVAQRGVAVMLGPTRVDSQRIMLTPPSRGRPMKGARKPERAQSQEARPRPNEGVL